jgi:uncharacterized repeat protein (TIGR01451 family)
MSVTNTPPPPPNANEGDNLTYTLVVTNNDATNSATGVVLTDTLGTNLVFVSATTTQGTFTQSGGVVTFSMGTVGHGATVTATVTAQATEDGSLSETGVVSANNPDPNPGNNTATASATVAEPSIPPPPPIVLTGKRFNNVTVATFTHANGVEPPSAFVATIHWGDGTTSTGTITESGGTYTVKGSHRYRSGGTHTVTTTVTESGAAPTLQATIFTPSGALDRSSPHSGALIATALSSSSPDSAGVAPGIAILDFSVSPQVEHGLGLQGIGLRLAAKGKSRLAGISSPDATS